VLLGALPPEFSPRFRDRTREVLELSGSMASSVLKGCVRKRRAWLLKFN
jgi:hypothetical protein